MLNLWSNSVFNRSGLAARSTLQTEQWKDLFGLLEREQEDFLAAEQDFRSPDYRWPRDILHFFSRIWEYPYAYHHLKEQASALGPGVRARVVDIGSAVTFFPFSVAKLGYHVHCLDVDAACGPDIERAATVVQHGPGKVDFRLISDGRLPLEDGEVEAAYCVSVLEHVPDFESSIEEVCRVLKPNGLFILTIDVDLCGYLDIGVERYYDLRRCLSEHFDLREPEITVHPLDVLQPRNGPFPYMTYSIWQKWMFHAKQHLKPLFGKKALSALPNLAIWCAVMTKKGTK